MIGESMPGHFVFCLAALKKAGLCCLVKQDLTKDSYDKRRFKAAVHEKLPKVDSVPLGGALHSR